MAEKRSDPRMRRLKEGRIVFNGKNSVMNCVVRDASGGGARITVGEPHLMPPEFDLVVPGAVTRRAYRVWVRNSELGLKFVD